MADRPVIMADRPVIYLFHGDDEPAIHGEIEKLKARVGGPGTLEMNFTRLDGRVLAFDQLVTACATMPFLAERRLVLLDHPLAYAKDEANREKLLDFLDRVPASTALVLIEHLPLTSPRDRKAGKIHWLELWAASDQSKRQEGWKNPLVGTLGKGSWRTSLLAGKGDADRSERITGLDPEARQGI